MSGIIWFLIGVAVGYCYGTLEEIVNRFILVDSLLDNH